MPLEYRFGALLYRKDLMVKAGITSVPKTWDELCQAAGKMNSPSVMGFAFGLSQADSGAVLNEFMENAILNAGSELFDDSGKAIFNNEAGLKFMKLLVRLVKECKAAGPAVAELTYNSIDDGIATGTMAMTQLGTHRFTAIKAKGAGDNLGWAPPVTFDGSPARVNVRGWVLSMGVHSKHPNEAWKLIDYLTSAEAQLNIAKGGEVPARLSTYSNDWFKQPGAATMVEWKNYIVKHGFGAKYPEKLFGLSQISAQATQAMVLSGVSPEQTLKTIVDTYNASLR
jgi:ABC-type glycerol-3-phosphate transport system substrate-binding protein